MIWHESGGGDVSRRLAVIATFEGTPEADDVSPEIVLPPVESGSWSPLWLSLRVAESGGEPEVALESSAGTGAFDPDPVGDVAIEDDEHEADAALPGDPVPEGAKVRFVCVEAGTAAGWTATAVFQEAAL